MMSDAEAGVVRLLEHLAMLDAADAGADPAEQLLRTLAGSALAPRLPAGLLARLFHTFELPVPAILEGHAITGTASECVARSTATS